jgi:uncharacterized membrane protein (UPF0127 family)
MTNKIVTGIVVAFMLGLLALSITGSSWKHAHQPGDVNSQVGSSEQNGRTKVQMALANTPELWSKGLSGYPQPDDFHGMLFDFGNLDKRCMWNKAIPYAVDVAFYDADWKMLGGVTMAANEEKAHCSPSPARYAVEMRGGWFRSHSRVTK